MSVGASRRRWEQFLDGRLHVPHDARAWLLGCRDCVDFHMRLRCLSDAAVLDARKPTPRRVLLTQRDIAHMRRQCCSQASPVLLSDVQCDDTVRHTCQEFTASVLRRASVASTTHDDYISVVSSFLTFFCPFLDPFTASEIASRQATLDSGSPLTSACTAALVLMCACWTETPSPFEMSQLISAVAAKGGLALNGLQLHPDVPRCELCPEEVARAQEVLALLRRRHAEAGAPCTGGGAGGRGAQQGVEQKRPSVRPNSAPPAPQARECGGDVREVSQMPERRKRPATALRLPKRSQCAAMACVRNQPSVLPEWCRMPDKHVCYARKPHRVRPASSLPFTVAFRAKANKMSV